MSRLSGKTALITGGGSGIGLAAARLFLDAGARVALAGRDAGKLARAAVALNSGERLIFQAADISDPEQVRALVENVTARLGRIDVLVNNAGLNVKGRTFAELTPASWRQLVGANLDGAFYCTHAVLPQMRERRDGVIVNVNSISGKRAHPLGGIGYVAAKFGLRGLAMGLAAEERAHGIRVSTLYPGEVNTPILDARPTPVTAEQRRQMLQPEDVAAAVLFVAALPPHVAIPELVITPVGAQFI